MADPGLLGVNAGAAFGVVLAVTFVGLGDFDDYVGAAFAGAAVLAVAVLLVDRGPSSSPATVVLAGVAFSAVLTGATTGLALLAPDRFNALRSWVAGSVTGRETGTIVLVAALTAVGLIVTAVVVRPLDQLELGEDLARSLGVPVGASRAGAVLAVTLLAGSATALAGPIVFVGLMVPQVAQLLAGPALGWRVLLSAVLGAALLIAADVVGRLLLWPAETPAGLVTAMLGAPALVLLVRARLGRGGALDTPNRAWAS